MNTSAELLDAMDRPRRQNVAVRSAIAEVLGEDGVSVDPETLQALGLFVTRVVWRLNPEDLR